MKENKIMLKKKCPKCKEYKEIEKFAQNKSRKDGYAFWCKICVKKSTNIENARQKAKIYYWEHKEKKCLYNKNYRRKNKAKLYLLNKLKHNRIYFDGKKETILARDLYQCTKCGLNREDHFQKYNQDLHIHHKDGKGRRSKNVNNADFNLITLCIKCHTTIHNLTILGKKDGNNLRYKKSYFL